MSAYWGLPDFGAPIGAPELGLFQPFLGGAVVQAPTSLDVAMRADGRLDFQLSLVRAPAAAVIDDSHAGLTLGLQWGYDDGAALAAARAIDRSTTLMPAAIQAGWARMIPGGPSVKLPDDLTRPTALGWGGLSSARWSQSLSLATGLLVKGALSGQLLLVSARAEVEVVGVAPRVPVTVSFNPIKLGAALLAGRSDRLVGREDARVFFTRAPSSIGLDVTPALTTDQLDAFAEAMEGRVRARFGTFTPSADPSGQACYLLAPQLDDGVYVWNLGDPATIERALVFQLDPLDAARKLIAVNGPALLIQEIDSPVLQLGYWRVVVSADLPPARQGVIELNARLDVAARPGRAEQSGTAELAEPGDSDQVQLRLAPGEKLQYTYQTTMVLQQNDTYKQLSGPSRAATATSLTLRSDDFPCAFLALEADAGISRLATIAGTLQYQDGALAVSQPFALSAAQPKATVALPPTGTGATISGVATALDAGAARLSIGPLPAVSQRFSLASFPQYGPQVVDLQCRFAGATGAVTVDLLGEGQAETQQNLGVYYLTPAQPTGQFRYTSISPFQYGYRWRVHGGGAWSELQHPGTPLVLDGDALAPEAHAMIDDLDGMHVYAAPGAPESIYYVPGDPTPELDQNGRPTLLLIASAAGGILQFGVRWAPNDLQLVTLQSDLQAKYALDTLTLRPAPVQVRAVVVSLGDGAGNWTAIKSSPSSGLPPYNTIFNATLDAAQTTQAVAAVNGRAGCLRVEFQIALAPDVAATFSGAPATLSRITDISTWFPGGSGKAHLQLTGSTVTA